MNKYIERTIKVVLSLTIFISLSWYVFSVLDYDQDGNQFLYWSYIEEEKNSLDGIVIGNSAINRAFVSPIAWNEKGLTFYSLSCGNQALALARDIMDEAKKTQDYKYVVIDIHQIRRETFYDASALSIERVTDNMPMTSWIRWRAVKRGLEYMKRADKEAGVTKHDTLNLTYFYLKFLLYHNRWQDIDKDDYVQPINAFKSAYTEDEFYTTKSFDEVKDPVDKGELTDYQKEMLKEIMDYANAEKINVLFVCSPSIMDDDNRRDINAAFEYIESNKSEYIDYYNFNTKEMFDTLNIDTKTDFYDEEHLNVYGAVKFTKYLANVISEKYGIKDKRGDEKLKSWDEAYDAYMEKKENMLD